MRRRTFMLGASALAVACIRDPSPRITMRSVGVDGSVAFEHTVALSVLRVEG